MSAAIPVALRRRVVERAQRQCEYCGIHEDDTHFGCQVDHVIGREHGGETEESNLAYACAACNRHKGTDLTSVDEHSGSLARLFNPRNDDWDEHFRLKGSAIEPRTAVGRVTARLLQFNSGQRGAERELLVLLGRYAPPVSRSAPNP